ncbi:hydroxymethylglutaryl-CoA reductase, degradative [Vagococcus acidifermentans]|uniref:3-hydroxy-3-methylglutaryl coenzyme A reductase n=1 Tax=Vagococcus acidifermentans TaxID=564710 RepID=A0A430B0I6_9ENTE|nr:hydroxymethylglutaryl-CoA reductase, degradative [Vagococcus acidifermentans]RSU13857.1 hydroxymethylglutaryl-CoA reductase, degradative [Vagococcus acidifermentans]
MTSNMSKFYQLDRAGRIAALQARHIVDERAAELLYDQPLLPEDVAGHLIENQVSQFPLPMGVALNFIIDGRDVVVPLVVEEPSVIAACSNGAKFMRKQGGFTTTVAKRLMIGQIILKDIPDFESAIKRVMAAEEELIALSKQIHPSIVKRSGGVKQISVRTILNEEKQPEFLTVHVGIDVQDAMGANIINTILEGLAPEIIRLTGANSLMSILSNYNTDALVTATCQVAIADLTRKHFDGRVIAEKIVEATRYADLDPYRAATHNKGTMNGIDSVVIASGNDPRAVEAGAHAYASRSGQYRSMTQWEIIDDTYLKGTLTLPMAVGSIGGAISVLPMAQANLKMMKCQNATDLARIIVSVGLAQNFAALRALVSEGIQKGHMSMQANSLAISVGAQGDEIPRVARQLRREEKMNTTTAARILEEIRKRHD